MFQLMQGHQAQLGLYGGFQRGFLPTEGAPMIGPSVPIITRGLDIEQLSVKAQDVLTRLERGEASADLSAILLEIQRDNINLQRAITSTTSALPIRENLEEEAKILVPMETPFRNLLPRTMGSGLSSHWRQVISMGGGYAPATTANGAVTGSGTAQSIAVVSSAGFAVGDVVWIDTGASSEAVTLTAIVDGTHMSGVFASNHNSGVAITKLSFQPGSPQGFIRSFFAESGAPADHATKYADQSAAYKLLGTYGSVTVFAMAAGANFQPQLAFEKTMALRNLMLNEEYALISGDATATAAPWGDGSTAMAFNGILNLVTTTNGTPPNQVQASVGALTIAHIDAQLSRLWNQGAQDMYMLVNEQEARSLAHLADATGSIIRIVTEADSVTMGKAVTGYIHPVSKEKIPIYPDRFMPAGTILFGSKRLPDGTPTADVQVLPQVQLPQLAPNENVQGYTAMEIASTTAAPQVLPFMCSVFETLRLKSALHMAKSTGITAV